MWFVFPRLLFRRFAKLQPATLIALHLLGSTQTQAITLVQPEVLNFDDYSFMGATSFAPVDQFKSKGVIFSRPIPVEAVAIAEPEVISQFIALGGTLPNALALQTANGLEIDMSFVVPGTSTPAVTSSISALFWDTAVGSLLGRIEAFAVNGNSITSVSAITNNSRGQVLTLSGTGIARVRLSVDSDGADLDNMTFPTPIAVPEPSTVALLGLVGFMFMRRVLHP